VVIKSDGSVDEKATVALRAKLSKKRGKPKLFDFGGTIPELKKACKKETGLDAPKQPVFQARFVPGKSVVKKSKKAASKVA
jgi:N-methylhydantoinase B